jgi:flagellar biosynthesis/type III secretory pathway chaperone
MNNHLNELAEVLEAELSVGEALCRNLEAQQKALLAWNIADLVDRIEAREPWLRSLGELEQRRSHIVSQSVGLASSPRLRQLIGQLPKDAPERARLNRLQEQTREVFLRVRWDEQYLHGLMENLLRLLQEALAPLMQPNLPTYDESGATERQRPVSALLQSKV